MIRLIRCIDGSQDTLMYFKRFLFYCQQCNFHQRYVDGSRNNRYNSFISAEISKPYTMIANDFNKEPTDQKIRRINERKQRYKRSTNNSHKKFINIARRLLFKQCTIRDRQLFQAKFQPFKNSRAYFFILLAHAKIRLRQFEANEFRRVFVDMVKAKMEFYQKEIDRTDNKNFINFRFDEIADMQFCLKACDLYFEGAVEEAIETIYKKEKITVLKKQQYEVALEVINDLEKQLRSMEPGPLFPYFGDNQLDDVRVNPSFQVLKEGLDLDDDSEYKLFVQREHTRKKQKKIKRYKRSGNNNCNSKSLTPLLFLEQSYPIYPHFFSIIYPYDPVTLAPIPQTSTSTCYDPAANNQFDTMMGPLPRTNISDQWFRNTLQNPHQSKAKIFKNTVSDIQPHPFFGPSEPVYQQVPCFFGDPPIKTAFQLPFFLSEAPKPIEPTGFSVNGMSMGECK